MKKIFILLFLFLFNSNASAIQVDWFQEYGIDTEVNYINLNGNIRNIINVINGGLDNTNSADNFEFVEIVGSLPVAGNEDQEHTYEC